MSVEAVFQNPIQKKAALKNPQTKWRTISQERIYGQKLLDAIKSTKNSSQPSKLSSSRAIKDAADSALALTAKGQTRWSRAILKRRWQKRKLWLKAGGKIRRCSPPSCPGKPAPIRTQSLKKKKEGGEEEEEEEEDRLRVLSRLVPGGRKLSTTTLLEEAVDYVAALEMQVKAMRALADLLSSTSISPSDET